jgi:hypothetical protein
VAAVVGLAFVACPHEEAEAQERGGLGAASSVRGRVLEHETGNPLADALVTLTSLEEQLPSPGFRLTDADGGFIFQNVFPGFLSLGVALLGYQNFSDTILVEPDSDVRIVVELSPAPIELEAVVVSVKRVSPAMGGFEGRRRRGNGTFITREEIEETNPLRVTDALFMVPGISFADRRFGEREIRMRDGCRPTVWVNGGKAIDSSVSEIGIDQVISPEEVEAIEVYRGAGEVPVQFGPETCGAVVIWTRLSLPEAKEGSVLKRMLVAAGLVVGILLLR